MAELQPTLEERVIALEQEKAMARAKFDVCSALFNILNEKINKAGEGLLKPESISNSVDADYVYNLEHKVDQLEMRVRELEAQVQTLECRQNY